MKRLSGPFADPSESRRMSTAPLIPLTGTVSGELSSSVAGKPLGVAGASGRVRDVYLSVGLTGKEDVDYPLQISGEVYINGVSCLSTKPCITTVSGETPQQKTTRVTGDAGITQAVINGSANSFTPGDLFTFDIMVSRTSPTQEMRNAAIVVELEPDI